jgi:hypothetical protein
MMQKSTTFTTILHVKNGPLSLRYAENIIYIYIFTIAESFHFSFCGAL